MDDTMGIDISKDNLDSYWFSEHRHKQFANSRTGLKALVHWIRQSEVALVVFEGTIARQGLAQHDPERGRLPPAFGELSCRTRDPIFYGKPASGPAFRRRNRHPGQNGPRGCLHAGPDGGDAGVESG